MDKALQQLDVTTPQYAALSALELSQRLSNAQLAKKCFVTAQTMIRIIRNLEEEGLIGKLPHPSNLKVLNIELTDRGKKLLNKAHLAVEEVERNSIKGISHAERVLMSETLLRMISNLKLNGNNEF